MPHEVFHQSFRTTMLQRSSCTQCGPLRRLRTTGTSGLARNDAAAVRAVELLATAGAVPARASSTIASVPSATQGHSRLTLASNDSVVYARLSDKPLRPDGLRGGMMYVCKLEPTRLHNKMAQQNMTGKKQEHDGAAKRRRGQKAGRKRTTLQET